MKSDKILKNILYSPQFFKELTAEKAERIILENSSEKRSQHNYLQAYLANFFGVEPHVIKSLQLMSPYKVAFSFYQKESREVEELQQKFLAYDKALQEKQKAQKFFPKNRRTIAEQEDIIINKFGGKKLDLTYFYAHLEDFLFEAGELEYLQLISPCKIIFQLTEEIIPDEYFYSLYLITFENAHRYTKPYDKETIVYITSRDGLNVYTVGLLSNHIIRTKEFNKKLYDELCQQEEGVALYEDEIEPILE